MARSELGVVPATNNRRTLCWSLGARASALSKDSVASPGVLSFTRDDLPQVPRAAAAPSSARPRPGGTPTRRAASGTAASSLGSLMAFRLPAGGARVGRTAAHHQLPVLAFLPQLRGALPAELPPLLLFGSQL